MEVGDHMKPRLWSLRDLHHMVDILPVFQGQNKFVQDKIVFLVVAIFFSV